MFPRVAAQPPDTHKGDAYCSCKPAPSSPAPSHEERSVWSLGDRPWTAAQPQLQAQFKKPRSGGWLASSKQGLRAAVLFWDRAPSPHRVVCLLVVPKGLRPPQQAGLLLSGSLTPWFSGQKQISYWLICFVLFRTSREGVSIAQCALISPTPCREMRRGLDQRSLR